MMTLKCQACRRRLLGVGVAAENLEDRCTRIRRVRKRRDADLLNDERDARDTRRAVAPAANRERRRSRQPPSPACWGR